MHWFGSRSYDGARPLARTSRICIVGAGPAGITAAATYKELGFDNVIVLERNAHIGGRCETTALGSDMGATAWAPWYYRDVFRFSDAARIKRAWIPTLTCFDMGSGRQIPELTLPQIARAAVDGLRYFSRWPTWRGVRGPAIGSVSEDLCESWWDFAKKRRLTGMTATMAPTTEGYGYRREAPAFYFARYINPLVVAGSITAQLARPLLGSTGLGYWRGGTQQIWSRTAAEAGLDVRTQVEITQIRRSRERVRVWCAKRPQPLEFDFLVLACQPQHIIHALDATPEEVELFNEYQTFDYRSYECEVSGLGAGEKLYAALRDNLSPERGINRPSILFKRNADANVMVVFVNSDRATADDEIERNIADDLGRIGGKLRRVVTARHHDYMPHVSSSALRNGFYQRLQDLQGRRRTLGVGASHTFDIMPEVVAQARDTVHRHAAGAFSTVNGAIDARGDLPIAEYPQTVPFHVH